METDNTNLFSEPSDFTDVTFLVEDKRLYVNKGVLAVTSPVFAKMFYGDFKEKSATEITLPGKKYDDMIELLMCIYPSTAKPVSRENLDIILPLMEEYQIDSLRARCDAFIANMVEKKEPSVKELIHLLVLGGKYRLVNSVKWCVEIASRRSFSEMKREKEFADISSDIKYQFTSLELERYEKGVKDLMSTLQSISRLEGIFDFCFHPETYRRNHHYCAICRAEFIPNILRNIENFVSK